MDTKKKILLVEDDTALATVYRSRLELEGFEIREVSNGEDALSAAIAFKPDLILLDAMMPKISGFDVLDILRNTPETTNIRVIMLTALSSLNDKIEGYDAGADDYIIKPFEFRELLMKIRVLLKRTMNQQMPSGNILRAADLEMNLDSKEVKRDGIPISLTAKEFQLLEYLMRNKNRVVSRADIAINVWDIDFDTNTNVIDVYINYVRNKIDKQFEQKLIQTQVGMGYVLKENR